MNASLLFIKVKLLNGQCAHLDLMQIIAMEERESDGQHVLRVVLMGGYELDCLDDERTGVEEINKMKAVFVQQAMNPQGIVVPNGQIPKLRG